MVVTTKTTVEKQVNLTWEQLEDMVQRLCDIEPQYLLQNMQIIESGEVVFTFHETKTKVQPQLYAGRILERLTESLVKNITNPSVSDSYTGE
jgi:hypothetical protein